jgi:hypothetical protein
MAATVKTYVLTSTTPTEADSSDHLRFKNADDNTNNNSDPIQILASGVNTSFKKTIALYATVAPATSISNVKLYSDGTSGLGTGVDIEYKLVATDGYSQATDNTDNGGSTVFALTSASPASLTGSIGAATGRGTLQLVELQMMVNDTATPGDLVGVAETLTWQYDEA